MENSGIVLTQIKSDREDTIKSTIKETFQELAILADSLVESAKSQTSTREEYIAFLKGAAFIFHSVCEHDVRKVKKAGVKTGIVTVEDAIEHCYDLLPFMHEEDKVEHLKLAEWLKELVVLRKKTNNLK